MCEAYYPFPPCASPGGTCINSTCVCEPNWSSFGKIFHLQGMDCMMYRPIHVALDSITIALSLLLIALAFTRLVSMINSAKAPLTSKSSGPAKVVVIRSGLKSKDMNTTVTLDGMTAATVTSPTELSIKAPPPRNLVAVSRVAWCSRQKMALIKLAFKVRLSLYIYIYRERERERFHGAVLFTFFQILEF